MGMSEEQRKDMKFKLTILAIVLAIGIPALVVGPLLPSVLESYRTQAKTAPTADVIDKYVLIIQIQAATFREEEAMKTIDEFWKLFVDDDAFPWDEVPESSYNKYAKDGPRPSWFYWLKDAETWDEETMKPPVVKQATIDQVAAVMLIAAAHYDEKRDYYKCDHIFTALSAFCPPGSEGKIQGDKGLMRSKVRQF